MQKAETVIIGGGVAGASVAYHLAERGAADVLIVDREAAQGLGSTGKATGGIRSQFETDINILMSVYSIDFFRNWEHDSGYEPRGYLFFATDKTQLEYLEKNVEKQRSLGVQGIDLLAPDDVRSLVSLLNCDDIVGATFGQFDGFIDPIAVMNGFTQYALERGTKIEFGVEATRLRIRSGRIEAAETNRGPIECKRAVICSGPWARALASTAGTDLPVEAARRQIVWARTDEKLPPALPMVIDLGNGFHFRPAKNSQNELMFAYPDREEGPSFCTDYDDSFTEKVFRIARHRAPFLCRTMVIPEKCRAGLYENTPDHHAILGGCDIEGLYFACGFSGHGVMHSPATGRALSEIILDGRSEFLDVSSLTLARFARGDLLHETAFI